MEGPSHSSGTGLLFSSLGPANRAQAISGSEPGDWLTREMLSQPICYEMQV